MPEEILLMLEDFEEAHGSRINRTLLAAILQFFFAQEMRLGGSKPVESPDMRWMQIAVRIEDGKLKLSELPAFLVKHLSANDPTDAIGAGENVGRQEKE